MEYYCLACGAKIAIFDDESAECTGCSQYWETDDRSFWEDVSIGPNFKT